MKFDAALALGRRGEHLVAWWLQSRGWGVIASYDFAGSDGDKAPKLKFSARGLLLPDLDVCRQGQRVWVEVKTYATAGFNRKLTSHVHGLRERHYLDYLETVKETGGRCMLAVLELDSKELLMANLSRLEPHPCQCGCTRGSKCRNPIPNCVYFERKQFKSVHVFGQEQISKVQAA